MINLGLSRVRDLLTLVKTPQRYLKVFHVAGTNGKGSVCTFLEAMLERGGLSTGKFTSPHLCYPNDSIQINGAPIDQGEYSQLTEELRALSTKSSLGATEFEIQTAVAFTAFKKYNVDVAIVEVGLGGLEDATNVLEPSNVLCTAITKVSIDHEGFLGSSLESIAQHKGGIIKAATPCVLDASNAPEVIDVVQQLCETKNAPLILAGEKTPTKPVAAQNWDIAVACIQQVFPQMSTAEVDTVWPGRLQWIGPDLLVDGAHNIGAATELRKYVDSLQKGNVRWVLAFSKPPQQIMDILVRPGDEILATEFGPVDGMPWVKSQPAQTILAHAESRGSGAHEIAVDEIEALPRDRLTVVAGSLYLVGEFLRSLKK